MTKLRAKVVIEGELEVLTGLHVGSAAAGMQIGSVDAPVVRDPVTGRPYIPGSSLKGKLRSLLEAAEGKPYNRSGGRDVRRHECDSREDALGCAVCRLFGSIGRNGGDNQPARLAVSDLLLTEDSFALLEAIDTGLMYTEWKFENTLDRVTSAAMPRQIERVPAGSVFALRLVCDDREEGADPAGLLQEDLTNLSRALGLLEDDALGGHGSRGYGRVAFVNLRVSRRPVEQYGTREPFPSREVSSIADLVAEYARA
ncbi:MAG: type III-A CRISPR-associated RAMP protein Csm3 [Actinomycetota bacterium]|nr:type III-A CRISPR-associated RAMP protein Csm3 [Actinomycetota bacterium]